jgi:DNA polymerase alpha-associated DNA helicase A
MNSLKLANSVTFDRMERTLAHLRRIVLPDSSAGQSAPSVPNVTMVNCLLGLEEPQWLDEVPATFAQSQSEAGGAGNDIQWFGGALNESQKEAISFCLKAQTIACIHGPPGVSSVSKPHVCSKLISARLVKPIPSSNSSFNSSLDVYQRRRIDHLVSSSPPRPT